MFHFTTGIAQVPLSLNTQNDEDNGQDNAGPLPSGHKLVGRMGDFDNDGFLDGILVLAANAPLDLVVARGNPIAQIRPWTSDIPIDPISASVLTLNGVVRNYSQVINQNFSENRLSEIINNLHKVTDNTRSVLRNICVLHLNSDSLDFPRLKDRLDNYAITYSISRTDTVFL